MAEHLSGHHRTTVEKIFQHPTGGNVEWRQARSLLEAERTRNYGDDRWGKPTQD